MSTQDAGGARMHCAATRQQDSGSSTGGPRHRGRMLKNREFDMESPVLLLYKPHATKMYFKTGSKLPGSATFLKKRPPAFFFFSGASPRSLSLLRVPLSSPGSGAATPSTRVPDSLEPEQSPWGGTATPRLLTGFYIITNIYNFCIYI